MREELLMLSKCQEKTEVYSRVCGFFRPVQQWNKGKKEEFRDRREYVVVTASK
jgi:ribonucleoside-triphosphate reductase